MRLPLFGAGLLVALLFVSPVSSVAQVFRTVTLPGGTLDCQSNLPYQLVFHDEFEGSVLDTQKWYTFFPYGPSIANADQCFFCRTRDEDETPNSGEGENQVFLDQNLVLQNGRLLIRSKAEAATWMGKTYPYSSGLVTSKHHYFMPEEDRINFQYGRV